MPSTMRLAGVHGVCIQVRIVTYQDNYCRNYVFLQFDITADIGLVCGTFATPLLSLLSTAVILY